MREPFVLLFGFKKGTQKTKGERVLLGEPGPKITNERLQDNWDEKTSHRHRPYKPPKAK